MFGLWLCICVDIKVKNLFYCDYGDIIYNFNFILQIGVRESVKGEGDFGFIEI